MKQGRQWEYRASRFNYTHTVCGVGETAFPSPLNPYHTVHTSSLFLSLSTKELYSVVLGMGLIPRFGEAGVGDDLFSSFVLFLRSSSYRSDDADIQ
jgi:hypothetical protein